MRNIQIRLLVQMLKLVGSLLASTPIGHGWEFKGLGFGVEGTRVNVVLHYST